MCFEDKMLYGARGEIPHGDYTVPFGRAAVKREGEDVSIIAIGSMVPKALEAAVVLEDAGCDAEVVDPRTPSPLDRGTVCASARGTGHAVVCGEDSSFCGASAELSAMIAETCFSELKAPVARVGSAHAPMPFSPDLVGRVVPGAAGIVAAVDRLVP